MWCSACGVGVVGRLCARCQSTCARAQDRMAGDVLVQAPYLHEGAPRQLVLALKYAGSPEALQVLAEAMVAKIEPATSALVPIPRAWHRRWKYGIDPGKALARAISARTGLPVVAALRAPMAGRANAGAPRARRKPPEFQARRAAPAGAVLVDDVVTTGRTVNRAAAALGGSIGSALSATTVRGVTSLFRTEDPGGTWT